MKDVSTASPETKRKIRKVLALTTSSNRAEAEAAQRRLDELLKKHNLKIEDFAENIREIIDEQRTGSRDDLARLLAASMKCWVQTNRGGDKLAFVGKKETVDRARRVYASLVAIGDDRCEISPAGDPPKAARKAWRLCWWLGFVEAISRRLYLPKPTGGDEMPAKAPPPEARKSLSAEEALAGLEELARALEEDMIFDVHGTLERLRTMAHRAGFDVGFHVDLGDAPRLLR